MSRCHVQGRGRGAGNGVGKVKGQGVDALFPCWGGRGRCRDVMSKGGGGGQGMG